MRKSSVLVVVLLLTLLAACAEGALNVTGNWSGSFAGANASTPVTMVLTQNGTVITGTATNQNGLAIVNGTLNGSSLRLSFTDNDGIALTFTGTASGSTINGTTTVQSQTGPITINLTATKQ